MTDLSGHNIRGYQLISKLGEGAFGAVYRAIQEQVNREVAVKAILEIYANQPVFIRRFEKEAQIIAELEHLHIVPLYDYWRDPEGAYLVMRFIKGGSLADKLEGGPLDPGRALQVTRQIATALDAAHLRGIVHRDIKPDNILLDEASNAYLSDFGIAKDLGSPGELTRTGGFLGTPAYTTPEQAQSGELSPRTDIYSLGVVLYEMLVGGHPFPDTPLAGMLIKHIQVPLPSVRDQISQLPVGLDEVIQRATAKLPGARYDSTLDMVTDLEALILEHAPQPGSTETELTAGNPYKGLRPFKEGDSLDYFGREELVAQLLGEQLTFENEGRLLAVVGPSGSGKSSLVRAGLLPAIRSGGVEGSENWFIALMVPGDDPDNNLAQALETVSVTRRENLEEILLSGDSGLFTAARMALTSDEDTLLLVIDQFEELYTGNLEPEEIDRFINLLLSAATRRDSPVRIILTLRADFYDRPLMHPDFGPLLEKHTRLILPLRPEEMAAAVRGPLERIGGTFESGLVSTILTDVGHQAGALPLLQYALTELYERRNGHLLTHSAFVDIGGVLGALAQRAEELFTALQEDQQEAARQLFLRLVTLGEGVEDTRRRVLMTELSGLGGGLQPVLDLFGRYRLLTFDRDPHTRTPTVEVAHEALLRQWSRLRGWLDESRADLRLQRVLARDASAWQDSGTDPSYLLRGARLDPFEAWQKTSRISLTGEEQEYLDASLEARDARTAEELQRQERERSLERRSLQRLRIIVTVLILASIAGIILTTAVFRQGQLARENEALALDNAATALSAEEQAQLTAATAVAAQEEAITQAEIAKSQEAIAKSQEAIALDQSMLALARQLSSIATFNSPIDQDPELALLLALESAQLFLDVEDTLTHEAEAILHQVLRLALPRELFKFTAYASEMALSPNSTLLVANGSNSSGFGIEPDSQIDIRQVFLWDVSPGSEGTLIAALDGHDDRIDSIAFHPDGTRFATGSRDRTIRIWDASTFATTMILTGHAGSVLDLAFSPDGKFLVSAGEEGVAIIWDLENAAPLWTLSGHGVPVSMVRYHPGGHLVATAGQTNLLDPEGELFLWDPATGQTVKRFLRLEWLQHIAFSPDGGLLLYAGKVSVPIPRLAATTQEDSANAIHVWDLNRSRAIHTINTYSHLSANNFEGRFNFEFLNDSGLLLSVDAWAFLFTWRIQGTPGDRALFSSCCRTGTVDWAESAGSNVPIEVDHLGGRVYLIGGQGEIEVWDFSLNQELPPLYGISDRAIDQLDISPDGNSIVILSGNEVSFWDLIDNATGARMRFAATLPGPENQNAALAIRPDGSELATGRANRQIQLWQIGADSLEETRILQGHSDAVLDLVYSPDGRVLASAGADNEIILWDLESGEIMRRLRGHATDVRSVSFSPDGRVLASGSDFGTVRIWEVESGTRISLLNEHKAQVSDLVFSPDGSRMLSISQDGTGAIWDTDTWEVLTKLYNGDPDAIKRNNENAIPSLNSSFNQAAFSPDGTRIFTATEDGLIIIWDAASGEQLFSLYGHEGQVLDLALSLDGARLLTVGEDRSVNFFILDPDELLAYVRSLAARDLTETECRQYLHLDSCPED